MGLGSVTACVGGHEAVEDTSTFLLAVVGENVVNIVLRQSPNFCTLLVCDDT